LVFSIMTTNRVVEEKRRLYEATRRERQRKRTAEPEQGDDREVTRDELVGMVLRLYEVEPEWTRRDLVLLTGQPQRAVYDVIRQLCITERQRGWYRLRDEFKLNQKKEPAV
jgi:hypothetical protein